MGAVVDCWMDGLVKSDAVRVALPGVISVIPQVFVPATSAALAGRIALVSLEAIATTSVMVLTRFQQLSAAATVTLKELVAVWALGLPVLPPGVPGAAISP